MAGSATQKIIVLLADGTGNSAAKLFKTNVWRLYRALDTADPPPPGALRQVAYYHDGVGTSTFKPLLILGGVFGIGLKRNVLDLYSFLCRNYRPDDRIYLYGFSRGAFTARVLAGLIISQGILDCPTEAELQRYTRDAYRGYRRGYKLPIFGYKDRHYSRDETVGIVDRVRDLRDWFIKGWRALWRQKQFGDVAIHRDIKIDFVGVWDTVAAYGLPIDELTRGIDEWVWPLSMPNYVLSPSVLRARHALALDDERNTFHPLVWDEVAERKMIQEGTVQAGRLQQVWFAGMHSNVGGGYPDDTLSYGALEWMIAESEQPIRPGESGLRILPVDERETRADRDDFGTMYNSRSGVGSYYRYQPRKIAAWLEHPDPTTIMMQDPNRNGVGFLTSVTVHESVPHRIAAGNDRYAPIVLPDRFDELKSDGTRVPRQLPTAVPPSGNPGPAPTVSRSEWVFNDVWRRRVNYFMTVGVSLILAFLPLIHALRPPTLCTGPQCMLSPVIEAVGEVLPGFVQPWIRAFATSPGWFLLLALAIILLLTRSADLKRRIHDGMRELWVEALQLRRHAAVTYAGTIPNGPSGGIYALRSRRAYQKFFQWLKWRTIPGVFGVFVLVGGFLLALLLLLFGIQRADIAIAERSNRHCQLTASPAEPTGAVLAQPFSIDSKCWASGVRLRKNHRYALALHVTEDWVDRTIPASPLGFPSSRMKWYARPWVLARRSLAGDWFTPIAKVIPASGRGGRSQLLDMHCNCGQVAGAATAQPGAAANRPVYSTEFVAPIDGELVLFVNDMMPLKFSGLLPSRLRHEIEDAYRNNQGKAQVTIREIPRDPPSGAAPAR